MASAAVCEHCMTPVAFGEPAVWREGFSYHKKCRKCYVCSETDLHNAEVFQGVIFCAACAQRIFQGCSTARRTKTKPRRRRLRRERREQVKRASGDTRVIEMARLACSGHSSEESTAHDKSVEPGPRMDEAHPLRLGVSLNCYCLVDIAQRAQDMMRFFTFQSPKQLKQDSTDHGINTEATNVLLTDLRYPIEIKCNPNDKVSTLEELLVTKQRKQKKKKKPRCSDLRIAELGASTEIATMALRKHSDLTYKKSFSERATNSTSLALQQVSDVSVATPSGLVKSYTRSTGTGTSRSGSAAASDSGSGASAVEWVDSVCNKYRVLSKGNRQVLARQLGSLMLLPFKLFKKNILMRSSLVSVIMTSEGEKETFYKRLKTFFYEEIPKHRERGIKRLYSTINKRKIPYKLGWLACGGGTTKTLRPKYECLQFEKRCKHFHASHSYRCMRAQVMRLAGPTKSEMKSFRRKVKDSIIPPILQNFKLWSRRSVVMASSACGTGRSSYRLNPKIVRSI